MAVKKDDISLFTKNNISDAVVSKLIQEKKARKEQKDSEKSFKVPAPSDSVLRPLSDEISRDISDSSIISETLPDVDLGMQILVSSILSPKDMVNTELNYNLVNVGLEEEVITGIIGIIEDYFENTYALKSKLPDILFDILFRKGAYPIAVLPENAIDEVINSPDRVSLESISEVYGANGVRNLGILGNCTPSKSSPSLESFFDHKATAETFKGSINDFTTVTDNPLVLKIPEIISKVSQQNVRDRVSALSPSVEAIKKKEKDLGLEKKRKYERSPIVDIKAQEDMETDTFGEPLIKLFPMESVIPIHVPGDPKNHVGYYILLDKNGNPLNTHKESKQFRQLEQRIEDNKSDLTELLEKTKIAMMGGESHRTTNQKERTNRELERAYVGLIEANLMKRLQTGVYGDNVEMADAPDVYRIMFSRALSKMETQVLFLPKDYMTYMAFDFDEHGIGRSLLEDSKILASIRLMLMFTNTMGAIRNSQPQTLLNIELDESDPAPAQTVGAVLTEHARGKVSRFPIAELNLTDITDYLQKSGVSMNVSGNPRYPTTKVDVEDRQRGVNEVDRELSDEMRKLQAMKIGLSPEHLDNAAGTDFAANVVSSNLLLAKRVMIYQNLFTPLLNDHIQKVIFNHAGLLTDLNEYFNNSKKRGKASTAKRTKSKRGKKNEAELEKKEITLNDVIRSIKVSLPSPDTSKLENQMEAFNQYSEALENAIRAYFNIEMFDGMLDSDLEDGIEPMISAIMSYFQRQWLRKNNVMPELDSLVEVDGDGKAVLNFLEIHDKHTGSFIKTVGEMMRKYRKKGRRADARLEKEMDKLEDKLTEEDEAEEAANNPPEETPEGTPEDTPEETSEETPEEGGEEPKEDGGSEEPEETGDDSEPPEETPEGTPEETPTDGGDDNFDF